MSSIIPTISEFKGEYFFLSNFYAAPVELSGRGYDTVEHAYQAAKTLDLAKREPFTNSGFWSPGTAKRMGKGLPLRPDWERVKTEVMADLLLQKFQHPVLQAALKGTGDTWLVEGNNWGDTFWGIDHKKGGSNWLGRLLMVVRFTLRLPLPSGYTPTDVVQTASHLLPLPIKGVLTS